MPTGTTTSTSIPRARRGRLRPAGASDYREAIPRADLIANPGCYTSTTILGLAPLVADDLIERPAIIIDAKSGVSGAGRSPKLTTHFPSATRAFGLQRRPAPAHAGDRPGPHRRRRAAREPVEVIFTPHLVPMDRGILATIYATPRQPTAEHDLMDLYRRVSTPDCPFVRVVDHLPATKDSAHHELLRHHRPRRARDGPRDRLPGQPDQGRLRRRRAELQPDDRPAGDGWTAGVIADPSGGAPMTDDRPGSVLGPRSYRPSSIGSAS